MAKNKSNSPKKIIIKKQISFSKNFSFYASLFFIALICLNFVGVLYLIDTVSSIKSNISSLGKRIERVENTNSHLNDLDEEMNNYYRELSNKTDEAIDRILTIVGLLAAVVTFFGILLAFKAPRDIEKRIEENKTLLVKAKKAAREAKYQTEIIESLNIDYDGYLTNAKRIQQISKVIERYPDKPDAYMHRGFVYNKMEEASDDNKEKFLRLAISDYEIAHKLGVDISSYYNDMGVTYSNLEEYHKAISYFTKAIKKNPNDASVYTNRGHTYHNIKEYQKALNDFEKALDIDADYYAAYLARSYTYESLRRKETDLNKRINYIQLQIADLECVIKINPEDNESKNEKKHLEQFLKREISKENEKRGDLQSKKKEYTEAFKLYIDAILPYEKQYPLNQNSNKEFDVKFDIIRIISKLYDISSNDINFQKIEMKVAVAKFCQCMQAFAPFLYENGEKDTAEKLLILLLDHNNADIGKNAALNLAFMKRRCETRYTEKSAIELLELYPNQKSTVWCMNKALCYIDGIGVDVDWHRAIEILDNSDTDVLEALNWWEKINMVGEKENNIALLLFALSKKYHIKDDPVSFEERINKAKQDGYKIPDDLDF